MTCPPRSRLAGALRHCVWPTRMAAVVLATASLVFTAAQRRSGSPLHLVRTLRRTPTVFMPEGPECRVHAERLDAVVSGKKLLGAEILSGRYANAPPKNWQALLDALPATFASVQSHGKFIYWTLDAEEAVSLTFWSTLGMTGAWARERGAHSRVAFTFGDGGGADVLYYNDQRNFGTLTVSVEADELDAKLATLGPSWLQEGGLPRSEFLRVVGAQCASKRRRAVPLCKFLMDQSKTAGIGNYLLSELLHRAAIHPFAACGDLSDEEWADVHEAAAHVTQGSYASQAAIAAAGGARALSATRGTFAAMAPTFELQVYRRTADAARGLPVRQDVGPHGRSIFWVPETQTRARPTGE